MALFYAAGPAINPAALNYEEVQLDRIRKFNGLVGFSHLGRQLVLEVDAVNK